MTTTHPDVYLAPGRSLAMAHVGNQQYPLRSDHKCLVCTSPHRTWIEAELVRGSSYRGIARDLEGFPHGSRKPATRESISNHYRNGHMPLGQEQQRQIIEHRAKELGHSVEDGVEPLADHVTVARLMVQRGIETLADRTMPVTAADTLKAAAFLRQVERESGADDDSAIFSEALMVYLEVAKQFIPPEKQAAYARALYANPILRALYEKQHSRSQEDDEQVEDDIEDAEIDYALEAPQDAAEPVQSSVGPEDW